MSIFLLQIQLPPDSALPLDVRMSISFIRDQCQELTRPERPLGTYFRQLNHIQKSELAIYPSLDSRFEKVILLNQELTHPPALLGRLYRRLGRQTCFSLLKFLLRLPPSLLDGLITYTRDQQKVYRNIPSYPILTLPSPPKTQDLQRRSPGQG